MTRVALVNQEVIPEYRVGVYDQLGEYLSQRGFELTVISEGLPEHNTSVPRFRHTVVRLSIWSLAVLLFRLKPEVLIYWVRLRHLYLFPMLLLAKALGIKTIYWGHGADLACSPSVMSPKYLANTVEYWLSDALILYAEHLTSNVSARFRSKLFIANNTLAFANYAPPLRETTALLQHGISTRVNIVCTGRMQRRKRIDTLFLAFQRLGRPDVGLVLIGPDTDQVLKDVTGPNVFKLGPIYGTARLEILAACDVFCLPGAVGLSIVDAFYCGLPLVTEEGDRSPELMYLRDGINGFVTPRGDVGALTDRLRLLLDDEDLRRRFSAAARHEINTRGHIDRLCEGFLSALESAVDGRRRGRRQ